TWRTYALSACGVALVFAARALVGVMTLAAATRAGLRALLESYAFVLVTYAKTYVFPSYLDPFRPYEGLPAWAVVVVLTAALTLGMIAVAISRRTRAVSFGAMWTLVTFAPLSLSGPGLDMLGDRYAYYPMIGVTIALAAGLDALA